MNKTSNCVVLRHKPTGFIIKCHMHRMLNANQKEARRLLVTRLDNHINGENSIENQLKMHLNKKSADATRKRKKMNELKEKWKNNENKD